MHSKLFDLISVETLEYHGDLGAALAEYQFRGLFCGVNVFAVDLEQHVADLNESTDICGAAGSQATHQKRG